MDSRAKRTWRLTYRTARRIVIAVVGSTVVLAGIAMLILPGPGLLTIIGGLALLGLEFAFAKRWLARIKTKTRWAVDEAKRRVGRKSPPGPSPPTP